MALDDWAIVVGIAHYPGISDGNLEGPVADAADFAKWLEDPTGGDVPLKQITLIQSAEANPPPLPRDAKPKIEQIYEFFDKLLDASNENLTIHKKGRRVGRRLYVYYAGHGFEVEKGEVSLLVANAIVGSSLYHIPGWSHPDHFYQAGIFDEVILFMDCCREHSRVPLMLPPLKQVVGASVGRHFYGFATKWRRNAWEKPSKNGTVHGVFTTALLDGLRNGVEPGTNRITTSSLRTWLFSNMKSYLNADELADPDIEKEPSMPLEDDFLLLHVQLPSLSPVSISIPVEAKGQTLELLDGSLSKILESAQANPPRWELSLGLGLHQVRIKDQPQKKITFEVPGGGVPVNVQL